LVSEAATFPGELPEGATFDNEPPAGPRHLDGVGLRRAVGVACEVLGTLIKNGTPPGHSSRRYWCLYDRNAPQAILGTMRIDRYSFGNITIDGTPYTKDVILLGDGVHSPWWRSRGGHVFDADDFALILEATPEVVVMGTGAYGLVRVRKQLVQALQDRGVRVIAKRTPRAVEQYNQLVDEGVDVVGAFHLTC
jgi:hypothetical protein